MILIVLYFIIMLLSLISLYNTKKVHYNILKNKESFQIIFDNSRENYIYNSSISKENGNYVVYSRISNFTNGYYFPSIYAKFFNHINYLGITTLDKEFNIISQQVADPGKDLEDLRVFFWNDKKYFMGSMYHKVHSFYPVMITEDFKKIDILDENGQRYYKNKNFIPIVLDNKLYIINNHNPLQIYQTFYEKDSIKTKLFVDSKYKKQYPMLRGGSNYIYMGNNRFLSITHDMITNDLQNRVYRNYFTILNFQDKNKPYIEEVSRPVCLLGDCGIEFVMGLTESYDGGKYIITLGKNDSSSHVVILNKEEIWKYF